MNNKLKLLILGGGNGFIGGNLVKFYSKNPNYEVYATFYNNEPRNRPENVVFYRADLTDKHDIEYLFQQVQPDIVINCAAYTTNSKDVVEKPWLHVTENIRINSLVFEYCHTFKVKHCLFFSCGTMLKNSSVPQKESDWNISDEIYESYFGVASMKVYSEQLCQFYSKLNQCKFTVIRNSNIYGVGDKFDENYCHLMAATIKKVYNALDSIEIWGDKTNQAKRDLVYIDDLLDLVDRVIKFQKTSYELYNCGCGKAYSVGDIVKTVQKVLGKEYLQLNYNNSKPNIPVTITLDWTKAYEELGWYPKVSLEEGIQKTVEWYKENY